jgi:hypothetical protein
MLTQVSFNISHLGLGRGVGLDEGILVGRILGFLFVGLDEGLGTIRFVGRAVGRFEGLGLVGLPVGLLEGLGTIRLVGREVVELFSTTAAMYSSIASVPPRSELA